jgi:hypothetical protein
MPLWAHNDAGVSSHTVRSVHAQQRATLKTTSVSHGTTLEYGRVFTHGPSPWNPSKRDSVENVHKNCLFILFVVRKVETPVLRGSAARLSSPGMNTGAFRRDLVKGGLQRDYCHTWYHRRSTSAYSTSDKEQRHANHEHCSSSKY